ncbi:hypothetical protein THRCLA_00731 [Thraustotheca clavata]|uniref:GST C-terminal domain-containing protein n=1 Tax=Thraustotheca clavata TaxID=74557 RepID=A0A1W0AAD3_9STRA|nr:hypothetical protein THRCLA_00731 [Thraustotheca clavata]
MVLVTQLCAEKDDNLNTNVFPARLSALEKKVQGPYFGGDSVSFADIFWLDLYENTLYGFPGEIQVSMCEYPKLEAIITSLCSSENLKAYYAAKN